MTLNPRNLSYEIEMIIYTSQGCFDKLGHDFENALKQ